METQDEKEFYCENCETELDADDLEWLNDQAICPKCETFINI